MISLLILSFVAGVLTVLAPCILPVLPIVIGGSVVDGKKNQLRPYIVTGSLAISVILFTLILKVSTAFISVPPQFWTIVSGSIIILFGIISVFPMLWDKISIRFGIGQVSESALMHSNKKSGLVRDILVGASLGPVFSSCSPTYFLILATVLPQSFARGLLALSVYALGLSLMLLLIALIGQVVIAKVKFAADPHGWFKRGLGILFIIVGVGIIAGWDKEFATFVINSGIFDVTKIEQYFLSILE
jgi:cytochrome c-type biogenesis protein